MQHILKALDDHNWRYHLLKWGCIIVAGAAFLDLPIVVADLIARDNPNILLNIGVVGSITIITFAIVVILVAKQGYVIVSSMIFNVCLLLFISLAPSPREILETPVGTAVIVPICLVGITTTFRIGAGFSIAAIGAMAYRSIMSGQPWTPRTFASLFIILIVTGLLWLMHNLINVLQTRNQELKEASIQLADLEVARERTRIAHDLHDVTNYYSARGIRKLHRALRHIDTRPAVAHLEVTETIAHMKLLQRDARAMSFALRHGHVQPLETAIRTLAPSDDTLSVTISVTGTPYQLPNKVAFAAYRIAQEAFTNVIKHAPSATQITVSLLYHPTRLTLTIADNGRDVAQQPPSPIASGLKGMQERAEELGGMLVYGATTQGYQIHAELPMELSNDSNSSAGRGRPARISTNGAERS